MIAETDPQNPPIAYLTILKNSVYSIDQFAFQLEALSTRFRGDLWVVGPEDKVEVVGRFVVHVLKRKAGESKPALFWRLYSNILQRARDIQGSVPEPKVVVTYDPFRQGLLAAMIKRAIGWPTILEVNGAYARPENFRDMQGVFNKLVKPFLFRAVARITLGRADGIRLLYHNQVSGLAPLPARAVVRHFFDNAALDRFVPGPEEPFLLHVGYPFYRKGVDTLVDAFARTRRQFPEWRLVLIGHELSEHIPNPPDGVEILPGMTNLEVANWVSRCGCYVLASRSEAMGRVLLEAAAAGKPRIASRVDGTYTVVEDEVDGLMFNAEDVDGLARQLARIMGDPELRRVLGERGRVRAAVDFSAERYTRHYAEIVRSVIHASEARRKAAV